MKNYLSSDTQKLLIEYMISSSDVFIIVNDIVKHVYFDPEYRNSVKFIKKYYEKYSNIPTPEIINGEVGIQYELVTDITKDAIEYVTDTIQDFCKNEGMKLAILKASNILQDEEGNSDDIMTLIKNAYEIGIAKRLGVSFFDEAEEMLQRISDDVPISTGWPSLDDAIGGGLMKQSLTIIAAPSGVGKSLSLYNLSNNMSIMGLSTLIISLELDEDRIYKRLAANVTHINPKHLKSKIDEAIIKIKLARQTRGDIVLVKLPNGSCCNEIEAFLKESELKLGRVFDCIMVDYMDIMSPNNKSIPESDISTRDKAIAGELREIGVRHNIPIVTAAQQTKDAEDAKQLNHSHLSGGKYKSNICDLMIYAQATPEMKAQGMFNFLLKKTRDSDGVGQIVPMAWDNNAMLIKEPRPGEFDDSHRRLPNDSQVNDAKQKGNKLMGLIDNLPR
jgi:hypothetical protein